MPGKLAVAIFLCVAALSIETAPTKTGAVGGPSLKPPPGVRDKLTVDDLLNGDFEELVHNDYFMPIGETLPPTHRLSGVMHFSETAMKTRHPDRTWLGSGMRIFPEFSIPVISTGEHLLPLFREIIVSGNRQNSFWNIIVSPGRVWQEAGDGGYSRASFPFVLTDNYVGQARNGLATFVYNSSEISRVAIQISQETAPVDGYSIADFVGMIPARYEPQQFESTVQEILDFEEELAARPPVKPWGALPLAGLTQDFFKSGLSDEEVSIAALFLDGVLYLQPAYTRSGPYPYPLEMRHGVFSVTKTIGMGLSMFFAAEKYGEGIFDEKIVDFVPALTDHPGWRNVTFEDALGMVTGTQGGETGDNIVGFIMARTAEDKLAAINALPDAAPEPATEFRYASTNTFAVSYALSRYVKAKEGADADYWLMVKDNVLRPLGIPHLPLARTLEDDGQRGVPIMGWGSYPNVVEAAKIGRLLHDEGMSGGKQLLNKNKVKESLHRTSRIGRAAGMLYGNPLAYLHSMWIPQVRLSTCLVTAPLMSGAGGNCVVVLPSGVIAIRFGDSNRSDITCLVAVAEFYQNACPGR